jgi:hypothetical protein
MPKSRQTFWDHFAIYQIGRSAIRLVVNPNLYAKMRYDPLRDIEKIV